MSQNRHLRIKYMSDGYGFIEIETATVQKYRIRKYVAKLPLLQASVCTNVCLSERALQDAGTLQEAGKQCRALDARTFRLYTLPEMVFISPPLTNEHAHYHD